MKHIIKAGRRLDDSVASWITAAAVVAVAGDGAGVRMLLALDLLGVRLVAGHIRVLVRRQRDALKVLAGGRRIESWSYAREWQVPAGVGPELLEEFRARRAAERATRRARAAEHDAERARACAELRRWTPARRGALLAFAGLGGSQRSVDEAWGSMEWDASGRVPIVDGLAYERGQEGGRLRTSTHEDVGFGRALRRAVSHADVVAWETEVSRRDAERARGVARVLRGVAEAAWTAECRRREDEALARVQRLRAVHA